MSTSLKVSFLWTRTFFELFDNSTAASSPFSFFFRPSDYKGKIKSLYTGKSSLTLPWKLTDHTNRTNWFWKYYLNDINPLTSPHDTVANRCFPLCVPVRKSLTRLIAVDSPPAFGMHDRASFEGFFYRHGIACVCTFTIHDCSSLDEAVLKAMCLRHEPLFSIPGRKNKVSLTTVGDYCRNLLCQEVGMVNDWFDEDPFSLVTVVEGEGNQTVRQGCNIHRALEALASWDRSWRQRPLPVLSAHTISIKNNHMSDIMYGHANSRVLWIPRLFAPGNNYALVWYCRNLLMASMQVKSFRDFLVRADNLQRINSATRIGGYAREVKAILRNMEKGLKTYRTMSVCKQINNDAQLQRILSVYP